MSKSRRRFQDEDEDFEPRYQNRRDRFNDRRAQRRNREIERNSTEQDEGDYPWQR
jgi:hypothetical protein